jgi:rhamnosyltransferase
MKLVAIIIAFNPDKYQLDLNIKKFISEVDQLLIYKNSKIEIEYELVDKYGEKIIFLGNENNVGIGEALNAGILWTKNTNFTHILTLDQDSYFEDDHLLQFRKLIEDTKDIKDIGVYIPNFINRGVLHISDKTKPFEVSDGITSGSIIPLNVFNIAGGFNNFLFIDGVDNEFCYRIKNNYGLRTIMYPNIHLFHQLGNQKKSIFGFSTLNYSSFRTYYLVRNHILILKKYPKSYSKKDKMIIIKDFIFYRIIKVILAEKNKFSKIKSIIKGVYHGLKYSL